MSMTKLAYQLKTGSIVNAAKAAFGHKEGLKALGRAALPGAVVGAAGGAASTIGTDKSMIGGALKGAAGGAAVTGGVHAYGALKGMKRLPAP